MELWFAIPSSAACCPFSHLSTRKREVTIFPEQLQHHLICISRTVTTTYQMGEHHIDHYVTPKKKSRSSTQFNNFFQDHQPLRVGGILWSIHQNARGSPQTSCITFTKKKEKKTNSIFFRTTRRGAQREPVLHAVQAGRGEQNSVKLGCWLPTSFPVFPNLSRVVHRVPSGRRDGDRRRVRNPHAHHHPLILSTLKRSKKRRYRQGQTLWHELNVLYQNFRSTLVKKKKKKEKKERRGPRGHGTIDYRCGDRKKGDRLRDGIVNS